MSTVLELAAVTRAGGLQYHAQLALEARGHVPNADDGSAFVRFAADALLLIYVSSRR